MTTVRSVLTLSIAVVLAVLGGTAVIAQDTGQAKYGVRVPNGLAFSEFKGYESWQTVAVSHNEKVMAVILANPVMINAYKSGIPGNGKPFPDGSKMASTTAMVRVSTIRTVVMAHSPGRL